MEHQPFKIYSLVSVRSLYSLYLLEFDSSFVFAGESHNFWELAYYTDGETGSLCDEKIYESSAGDVTLVAPNSFHSMWVRGSSSAKVFIVTFDGVGLENTLPTGKFTITDDERNCLDRIIDEVPGVFSGYNINEYSKLDTTAVPYNVGYQIIKNNLELFLLSIIRRGKEGTAAPSNSEHAQRYSEIVKYLRENIDNNLTIQDICRDMFISPTTLKTIFKQFTGGGIMKYYNHLRCERCISLIKQGLSMKAISEQLGFSSQFYFTYFFKRETGKTPSEFKHMSS